MFCQVVQGFLQLKQKGSVADSWKNYACEFSPSTKTLKIKGKDGKTVHWQHKIKKAW